MIITPAIHEELFAEYRRDPVRFVVRVIGGKPDAWQCDALDNLALADVWNEAIMTYRGTGKTSVGAWASMWYLMTRWESLVVTTAPTFNKQVRDIQWREIHLWWNRALIKSPWLAAWFEIDVTRLKARDYPNTWFATGIACKEPANLEGFRAQHMMVYMDEAKTIAKAAYDAIHGMRAGTTEFKWLVVSSPGGPTREHTRIWTHYTETWPHRIKVHPYALRFELRRPEAHGVDPVSGKPMLGRFVIRGSRTYYSKRGWTPEAIVERGRDWGKTNPWYIAQVIGDPPTLESDRLIRYDLILEAQAREYCEAAGCYCSAENSDNVTIGVDVARSGTDRTVLIVMRGGKVIHADSISRDLEMTTVDINTLGGRGTDPKRPSYRSIMATAAHAVRLAQKYKAWGIAIDDVGLGGGVTDIVRACGFYVVPIQHGAKPAGIPEKPEDRKAAERRNDPIFRLANAKTQLAIFLRNGFDQGHVCLADLNEGALQDAIMNPLSAQLGGARLRTDDRGILHVEDPDEAQTEAAAFFDDPAEAKRSPDHFHALMYAWWLSGGGHRKLKAGGGSARHQGRLGRPSGPGAIRGGMSAPGGSPVQPISPVGVGGQAVHMGRFL